MLGASGLGTRRGWVKSDVKMLFLQSRVCIYFQIQRLNRCWPREQSKCQRMQATQNLGQTLKVPRQTAKLASRPNPRFNPGV